MVAPPQSFTVSKENRLLPDQIGKARAWGRLLAKTSVGDASKPSA